MNLTNNDRIMVISGDANFGYLMQRYVKMSEHQLLAVNLGQDILQTVQHEKPALIVLEVTTAGTMGWNTLHELKENIKTRNIPVMICSWLDYESLDLPESVESYLRMPIMYEDFETAIHDLNNSVISKR